MDEMPDAVRERAVKAVHGNDGRGMIGRNNRRFLVTRVCRALLAEQELCARQIEDVIRRSGDDIQFWKAQADAFRHDNQLMTGKIQFLREERDSLIDLLDKADKAPRFRG